MQSPLPPDPHKEELFALCGELLSQRPLIVGNNRGPLEFHLTPDGQLQPRRIRSTSTSSGAARPASGVDTSTRTDFHGRASSAKACRL